MSIELWAANRSLKAPAQRMTDFVARKASTSTSTTSYNMGLTPGNMYDWMPQFIASRLAEGFRIFDGMTKGFLSEEAQLLGVESRTSSPYAYQDCMRASISISMLKRPDYSLQAKAQATQEVSSQLLLTGRMLL